MSGEPKVPDAPAAPGANVFPDLPAEQAHLAHSRRCREQMLSDFRRVLAGESAADHVTQEYVEMTAAEAIDDLSDPATAEFFGRIDATSGESFHIGRRHIETADHDPVVVDWRAAIAAPFYRATVSDPFNLVRRRRFTLRDHELVAYNDERLDDPDGVVVAGGIPDPVLAEMGAARTGAMREIVATIQGEQDVVIRAPADRVLVVQGGPGTGKTAVGLHRAAYLLFEQRRRLTRDGVLVVGPNPVFLAYIADVLPSLGERAVEQRTLDDLLLPRVTIDAALDATEPDDVTALKGDVRMAGVILAAATARIRPPERDFAVPVGTRVVRIDAATVASWFARALDSGAPLHDRRAGLRVLARSELARLAGSAGAWGRAEELRKALDAAWPALDERELVGQLLRRPEVLASAAAGILTDAEQSILGRPGTRRPTWTRADALVLDEARGLLRGPPRTYGHVVVDEAQDLPALAFRAVARRCPSRSVTILGDLAQSTAPGGQESWDDVLTALGAADAERHQIAQLTLGYRVPAPILAVANELLRDAAVTVPPSRSARLVGEPPTIVTVATHQLANAAVDAVLDLRHRHRLSGIIAPRDLVADIAAAIEERDHRPVSRLDHLGADEIPVLAAEASKGLELDGVVAVEPDQLRGGGPRSTRLAYVVLTRAVQELTILRTTTS